MTVHRGLVWSALANALLIGCHAAPPAPAPAAEQPETIDTGPTSFVELSANGGYGCARRSDGLVACWGPDPASDLGLRPPGSSLLEATALTDLPPARAIVVAWWQACAVLEASGHVWCWGRDLESKTFKAIAGLGEVVELTSFGRTVCARQADGAVDCWSGRGEAPYRAFEGAIDYDRSGSGSCALDELGQVWCRLWGIEEFDEEDMEEEPEIRRIAVHPGALRVEVGEDLLCIVDEAGAVACGSLADGAPLESIPGLVGVDAFDLDYGHGCALIDGEVACIGTNGWGQLGDGSSRQTTAAVSVALGDAAVAVSVAEDSSCALRREAVDCWGWLGLVRAEEEGPHTLAVEAQALIADDGFACITDKAGALRCWGVFDRDLDDPSGFHYGEAELDDDPYGIAAASEPAIVDLGLGPEPIVELSSSCFLGSSGNLRCLDLGPPGDPVRFTVGEAPFEFDLQIDGVQDVVRGNVDCLVARGQVICRGWSDPGTWIPVKGLSRVTALYGDGSEHCVVHDRGAVACFAAYDSDWGLQVEHASDIEMPVEVASVFGDKDRGCAMTEKGELYCWVHREETWKHAAPVAGMPAGELGFMYRDEPCVLTKTETVMCWNPRTDSVHDLGFTGVVDVAAGAGRADDDRLCWLDHDGVVTCIGDNEHGELGKLPSAVRLEPLTIPLDQLLD